MEDLGSSYLELMISASKLKLTPKNRGWLRILTPASCDCSPEMRTSIRKSATKIANNNYNNKTNILSLGKIIYPPQNMRPEVLLVLKGWKNM
jgi:hypothetical protein